MNVYVEKEGYPDGLDLVPAGKATVEIGANETVTIEKMYGPLVFWNIRVAAAFATCEWVIERLYGPGNDDWREVARIPGQLESDFIDSDEDDEAKGA